ncbi:MAG: hypothetical protein GPJ54_20110 [Candidatus Heimdallarchaeota archaeon]|nr:hypothetical protein [Candidatus Heimdallarchaeota archaeon]
MPLNIQYFIPEWDDQVLSRFDFWNDRPTEDSIKLYSHEIYAKPNYDGILISKVKIDESKTKRQKIDDVGIHKYLKFDGPIFGDCGAWGYVKKEKPPYKTNDILNYYNRVGVNYGVSIDHLCISKDDDVNHKRRDLTIKNAKDFLNQYEKKDYAFAAVGAIQGWDSASYLDSLESAIDMGYTKIAIGGLARKPTTSIIPILESMQDLIEGKNLWLHLFGVSRLNAIRQFHKLGIRSFDSASALRQAWLGKDRNYVDNNYNGYTALRIPFTTRAANRKFKPFIESGMYSTEDLEFQETILYTLLRKFEFEGFESEEEIIESFNQFTTQFDENAPDYSEDYRRTLRDKPWLKCECVVCQEIGMDVIIFRGNNRNRRRGFHNTYVFFKLLSRIRDDPTFTLQSLQSNKGKNKHLKKTVGINTIENYKLEDYFE